MKTFSAYTTIGDTLLVSRRRPRRAIFSWVVRSYSWIVGLFVSAIVLISTYWYAPSISLSAVILYWLYKVVRPYVLKDKLDEDSNTSIIVQLFRCATLVLLVSAFIIYIYTRTDYLKENGLSNTIWLLYILPVFITIQYGSARLMWSIIFCSAFALFCINLVSVDAWNETLLMSFITDILWLTFLAFMLYVLTRFASDRSASLRLVHDIQQQILDVHSTVDDQLICENVVKKIASNFTYPHVHIFKRQSDGSLRCITGSSGEGQLLALQGFLISPNTNSIIQCAVATGKPYYSNNVANDPHYLSHAAFSDTRSELAVPIKQGTQTVAVLDIQDHRPGIFLPQDTEVMEILANHLGHVFDNIDLVESLRQSIASITRLQEVVEPITRRFLSKAELESTLQEIAQAAYEELKADLVVLYEHNPLTGKVTLGARSGNLQHPDRFNDSVGRTQTLVDRVLLANDDYYFHPDVQNGASDLPFHIIDGPDERDTPPFVKREKIVSRATLRLRAENNYVGVMFLNFRACRRFDDQERKLFFIFANLAAIAIQKAQAQQQQLQFEREELGWHLHDQITKVSTISELTAKLLDQPELTDSQCTKLIIIQDASSELMKELRFLHDTWKDTPSDNLQNEIEKIVRRANDVYGLDFSVFWEAHGKKLPPVIANQLRQMVTEAIHNTTSHARATQGSVSCIISETSVCVTIDDNGRGFDMQRITPRGLSHLQGRVRQLGGECHIESAPGKGTHISVAIPIR